MVFEALQQYDEIGGASTTAEYVSELSAIRDEINRRITVAMAIYMQNHGCDSGCEVCSKR